MHRITKVAAIVATALTALIATAGSANAATDQRRRHHHRHEGATSRARWALEQRSVRGERPPPSPSPVPASSKTTRYNLATCKQR